MPGADESAGPRITAVFGEFPAGERAPALSGRRRADAPAGGPTAATAPHSLARPGAMPHAGAPHRMASHQPLSTIPGVCEVVHVRGPKAPAGTEPDVLVEVPHGATRAANFAALCG